MVLLLQYNKTVHTIRQEGMPNLTQTLRSYIALRRTTQGWKMTEKYEIPLHMAMTLCKTVASPMHTYLRYHSLALSHRWRNRWDFAITWLTKTCLIVLMEQIPWRTTTLRTYWGVLAASIAASIVDTTSRCTENIASIKHLYGLFYYPRLAKPMWRSLKHG